MHGIVTAWSTYLLYACFAGELQSRSVFGGQEIIVLFSARRFRNSERDAPPPRDLHTAWRYPGQDPSQQHAICHTRRTTELELSELHWIQVS
jgi:hypothetical protein